MSVTMDMAGPDGAVEDLSDFETRKRTVTLKRPKVVTLLPDDELDQGRLASDLAAFEKWLYENGVFSHNDKDREVYATLRWQTYARLLHEMGYIRKASFLSSGIIDYNFTPADTNVARFRHSDLDFEVLQDGKARKYNLFDLSRQYLGYFVENGETQIEKNGLYGRFLRDLDKICDPPPGPDRDPYFTAARYITPPEKRPLSLNKDAEIPAFLKQPRADALYKPGEKSPVSAPVAKAADVKNDTGVAPADVLSGPALHSRGFFNSVALIATSSAGIAARSMVTSALITSVSRIAIVAGLGFFGVGALPAGIAAGVTIGAWKTWSNYQKNHSGVQASFGMAATATGALLGAFGMDALIEPVAQYVAEPLRNYVISPAGDFVRGIGLTAMFMSAKQMLVDPVANFFADRSGLQAQIEALKARVTELTQANDRLELRLAMTDTDVLAESDSGLITRQVKAVAIGPDGNPLDVTDTASIRESTANLSSPDTASLLLPELAVPADGVEGADILASPTADLSAPADAAVAIDVPGYEVYRVARGDNLYRIAQNTYHLRGNDLHEAVKKIITLNPEIASHPDRLSIDQPLKLPVDLEQVATAECDERRLRLGRSGACMVPALG